MMVHNMHCLLHARALNHLHFLLVATVAIKIVGDVHEGETVEVCADVINPQDECPVTFPFEVNITYQYSNGMGQPGGMIQSTC